MKISCLLIDDEPIAREVIESYIEQTEVLEVAGKYASAVEAFAFLQTKPVDLLFLDIEMPRMSGLDLLKTLPHPPKVIITTAYREYALEGYELDVLDYLVKPIPFERFMKAVGKMMQHKVIPYPAPATSAVEEDPFIFIKEERRLIKVFLHEIISLESQRDYVKIKTNTRQIITRHTIGFFEELLPANQFIRIHRSFIISIPKIESVTEHLLEAGGQEWAIGRNYKQFVFERLNIHKLMR